MSPQSADIDKNGVLPKITFGRAAPFENKDTRRAISGVAGNLGFPLQLRQIKIINFTEESVKNRLVVGNHRHLGESGQWEVIIVLGNEETEYFNFRYRNYLSDVQEKKLVGGDVVIVPPGCSLALVPLTPGAQVIEISNQEYRNMNYEIDELF
jgi:hypothetical protein